MPPAPAAGGRRSRASALCSSPPPDPAEPVEPVEDHLYRLLLVGAHDNHSQPPELAADLEVGLVVMVHEVALQLVRDGPVTARGEPLGLAEGDAIVARGRLRR